VDAGTFDGWLGAYKRAWEDRDPEAAADLFTEDATYHETPFDEPFRGRDGVFEYWSDVPRSQRDVNFSYEILATTGSRGVAHWRASFVRLPTKDPVVLDGIFLVKLDADGRCAEFREWWHKQEEKAS
jgi:SnoaL-like domain